MLMSIRHLYFYLCFTSQFWTYSSTR